MCVGLHVGLKEPPDLYKLSEFFSSNMLSLFTYCTYFAIMSQKAEDAVWKHQRPYPPQQGADGTEAV